ncbi:YchJ family protein [Thalassospira marina]|uniref:UPF0225 protein CSC3H3_09380 n=1 Tax=Thalassospira marina TaxID=2048283 RepID=A0ABM6Q8N1_9PROT|nr:YchJ family protein [Thalassospira marina]AUG52894.1 SecC motif-containing protein [Thalassospira marina]
MSLVPFPKADPFVPCPCGSNKTYGTCCGPFHAGAKRPATAEQLMRSRYCAFVFGNAAYLADTVPAENAGNYDAKSITRQKTQWTGLEIVSTEAGGLFDQTGYVEFIARFREKGRDGAHHEKSRFIRQNGKWLYVDGEFPG